MAYTQGNILDTEGGKFAPNTVSDAVYDLNKEQKLTKTLEDTPDRTAIGYPKFITATAYADGAIVYHQNKLWKFKTDHAAGAWNASEVDEYNVKQALSEAEEATDEKLDGKLDKDGYSKLARVGLADNLADEKAFSEMGMLHMTAASVEVTGSPNAITYPSKDIADGMSQVLTLEGNGAAFMQLYPAGTDGLFGTDSDCPNDLPVRYSDQAGTTDMGYLDCAEVLQVSDLTASDCALLSAILTRDAARSCATVWLDEAGNKLAVSVSEGAAAWTLEATGAAASPTQVCRRAIRVKASEVNCGASGADWWFTATKGSLRQIKDMAVKEGFNETGLGTSSKPYVFFLTKPFDTCSVMDWIHWLEAKEGAQGIETQNAGTLAAAKLYQIKAVTSANLLDPATGQAELPWYANEGDAVDGQYTLVKPAGSAVTLSLLNKATGLTSTPTVDAEGHFVIGSNSVLTVTAASLEDIGVLATYDGSMDEEELDEYAAQTLVIDVSKIYGKLDGEGEYVQVAPEGLRGAGSAADVISLVNAEASRKVKVKDMGDLDLSANTTYNLFIATISDMPNICVLKCGKYSGTKIPAGALKLQDKTISSRPTLSNHKLMLNDKDYEISSTGASQLKASLVGVKLWYPLATPAHYTSLIYRDNGVDIPLNQLTRSLQVCNWATTKAVCAAETETTVEGHTSVLPQSCSPVITSEYSSNIPETIDSHTQEIAALDTKVAALWAAVFPNT